MRVWITNKMSFERRQEKINTKTKVAVKLVGEMIDSSMTSIRTFVNHLHD